MFVGSDQIISRLDSQSKFQIFTPFFGRLKSRNTQRPKKVEKCLFYLSPITLQSLDIIHWIVLDLFFSLRDVENYLLEEDALKIMFLVS